MSNSISFLPPHTTPTTRRIDLTFDTELACKVGVNETLLFDVIGVLCVRPGWQLIEGRRWVRASLDDLMVHTPFWTRTKLHRVLQSLEHRGLILSTAEFNTEHGDRTKWYAISDQGEVI